MKCSLTDNCHEIGLQFTRKPRGTKRVPLNEIGRVAVYRSRNKSECVKSPPLAAYL